MPALLIQRRLDSGRAWTPEEIRGELLGAVLPTGHPCLKVGAGRLDLAQSCGSLDLAQICGSERA